jgi:hypothetical protein
MQQKRSGTVSPHGRPKTDGCVAGLGKHRHPSIVGSSVGTAFVRECHPFGEFTVYQATGGCIPTAQGRAYVLIVGSPKDQGRVER